MLCLSTPRLVTEVLFPTRNEMSIIGVSLNTLGNPSSSVVIPEKLSIYKLNLFPHKIKTTEKKSGFRSTASNRGGRSQFSRSTQIIMALEKDISHNEFYSHHKTISHKAEQKDPYPPTNQPTNQPTTAGSHKQRRFVL